MQMNDWYRSLRQRVTGGTNFIAGVNEADTESIGRII